MRRRGRIRIATFMAIIAGLAVAMAALRDPALLWVAIAGSLAFAGLIVATIGSAVAARHRPFWVGYAIAGWVYLALALGPWFSDHVRPALMTNFLLDWLWDQRFPRASSTLIPTAGTPRPPFGFDYQRFQWVGHSLSDILHALAGGLAGVWLARAAPEREPFEPA
jgi:hypothetical protein